MIVAYLSLAVWAYLLLAHGRFWEAHCLETPDSISRDTWPDVCIVIPARNEAEILDKTLPTLLTHDYPELRIILVNDNSEDSTAATAASIASQYPATDCLTVIQGHSRPGWKGKVAAMQWGLDHVANAIPPRYVLFTDADIAYDKGVIKRLVTHAEAGEYVLTSLMVHLRCKSLAERWLIPPFVYFFKLLYPFRWVNNPARKAAAAAGGCMLVRYDALMQAGGLEPIRKALIDDCALGRLMKRQGNIWLGLAHDICSIRAYPHVHDIRAMVARSAYDQLGYSPVNLAAALAGMILLYIAPVLLALFGHGTNRLLGIASWACMSLTFLPMIRFYGRPLLSCLTLPIIVAFYMAFTLDSAFQYRSGKGGQWKGRTQATDTKRA